MRYDHGYQNRKNKNCNSQYIFITSLQKTIGKNNHQRIMRKGTDQLETDVVASVIEAIPNPQNCLEDPAVLAKNMFLGYLSRDTIIRILFSGTRAGELVRKVEYQLKKILFDAHPEYKQDPSVNVVLSYTVYGGYYAFFENRQYGDATVVDIISQISSEAMNLL